MSARDEVLAQAIAEAIALVTTKRIELLSDPEGTEVATVRLLADRGMLSSEKLLDSVLDQHLRLHRTFNTVPVEQFKAAQRYIGQLERVANVLLAQVDAVSDLAAVKKTAKGRTLLEQAKAARAFYEEAQTRWLHGEPEQDEEAAR